MTEKNKYDEQAERFLSDHGLRMILRHASAKLPPWKDENANGQRYREHLTIDQHWRVTIRRPGRSLTFDFFNSINDTEKRIDLRPYSVLSCLSSDSAYAEYTPDELCQELGDDPDSRRAFSQAKAAIKFARRLSAFFTPEEIEALQEIR